MDNKALEQYLNTLLEVDLYSDYAPNGLQVEGKKQINNVVTGVTASLELIEAAIELNADALIVHHGYFWKGENPAIVGMKQRRIKALLENGINLYGYHLPLDAHVDLGNNATLGKLWHIEDAAPIAPNDLIWTGNVDGLTVDAFAERLTTTLGREPLNIDAGGHNINKVAWCSGGAQGFLEQAVALGVDAYISGEVSEKTFHEAKEYGIHYFAAGHHATERGGVKALADYLNKSTQLDCQFIDKYNPV